MRMHILAASVSLLLASSGCASTMKTMLNAAFGWHDKDKDRITRELERERRIRNERNWIRHWQGNPSSSPSMYEEYKDVDANSWTGKRDD